MKRGRKLLQWKDNNDFYEVVWLEIRQDSPVEDLQNPLWSLDATQAGPEQILIYEKIFSGASVSRNLLVRVELVSCTNNPVSNHFLEDVNANNN